MMTQNWRMPAPPALVVVNVDAADATKNYAARAVITADALPGEGALAAEVAARGGLDDLGRRLQRLRAGVRESLSAECPEAVAFLDVTAAALPDDAVVVADMCIPGYWLAGFLPVAAPRRLAYPMGWGTLGFALPAAVGAASAGAGPVVSVSGDGGFLFACGELATVAQEGLDLTAVSSTTAATACSATTSAGGATCRSASTCTAPTSRRWRAPSGWRPTRWKVWAKSSATL
jgi:acetolactate synthase-1/2/3 large subunit